NRNDESLTAYTRSFALETNGAAAAVARGYALINIGAFTDAVIAFDVALLRVASRKEKATALAGKGRALLRLKRYEDAVSTLKAALDELLTERDNDPLAAERDSVLF